MMGHAEAVIATGRMLTWSSVGRYLPSLNAFDSTRGFFRTIVRVVGWMDEVAIASILAALLLIVGPLAAAFCFFRKDHYLATALRVSLWILAAIAGIRDFRRRQLDWVSVTLGVVWLVATFTILWVLN